MKLILLLLISVMAYSANAASLTSIVSSPAPNFVGCKIVYGFSIRYDQNNETPTSVTWTFGDGTPSVIVNPATTPFAYVQHGYDVAGTYTVTAVVTSNLGTYTLTEPFTASLGSTSAYGASFTVSGTSPNFLFTYTGAGFYDNGHTYSLDFGDGTAIQTGTSIANGEVFSTHAYANPGNYTATFVHRYQYDVNQAPCEWTYRVTIEVAEDPCCANFSPDAGGNYWLSAWVQEEVSGPVITYSNNVYIELEFVIASGSEFFRIYPSEDIIEGWQRIIGQFIIPAATTAIKINMVNENSSAQVYFDDIRIHPFNSSMKSYVYDPETLWLTAELDDNNYATFYEYDKEGQMVRIKKETERGIMTIQESRSSNKKN